jgi:hypothetical protein
LNPPKPASPEPPNPPWLEPLVEEFPPSPAAPPVFSVGTGRVFVFAEHATKQFTRQPMKAHEKEERVISALRHEFVTEARQLCLDIGRGGQRVTIKGGYNTSFTQWNPELYQSIFHGRLTLDHSQAVWGGFRMIANPIAAVQSHHSLKAGSFIRNYVEAVFASAVTTDLLQNPRPGAGGGA